LDGGLAVDEIDADEYKIGKHSRFLDIGCGSGLVVLQVAAVVGCLSHGIDVVKHRVEVANQFLEHIYKKFSNVPDAFDEKVELYCEDASVGLSPFLIRNKPATHIFMFDARIEKDQAMKGICGRLNVTDFKMLISSKTIDQLKEYGLKDVKEIGTFKLTMRGSGQRFGMHVYVKLPHH
jgi:SAM-dependent methyltransferase